MVWKQNNSLSRVGVSCSTPSIQYSAEEWIDYFKGQMYLGFDEDERSVENQNIARVTFTAQEDSSEIKGIWLIVITERQLFFVEVRAEEIEFESLRPSFEFILESFQVID